ncbi:unnamed protein product [Nesidiocoris tenuis]|uniref:Uncharacterized protein n=1 Tax=Nesidiocoris tenuis TaxID=355587 RepID=A0A6H5FXJ0_9HEMI|nr:unnamed protein product [Nesidiocoris tenuis]
MRVHHSGVRPVRKNATWIRQEIHKSYDTRWSGSHFRSYTSPGRWGGTQKLRDRRSATLPHSTGAPSFYHNRSFSESKAEHGDAPYYVGENWPEPEKLPEPDFSILDHSPSETVVEETATVRAHEDLFSDVCVFSDVCHILSTCQVRIDSRTFIHEMFDSPFPEVWEDAVAALNRKLADPQQPAAAPSPTATDATPIITTMASILEERKTLAYSSETICPYLRTKEMAIRWQVISPSMMSFLGSATRIMTYLRHAMGRRQQ